MKFIISSLFLILHLPSTLQVTLQTVQGFLLTTQQKTNFIVYELKLSHHLGVRIIDLIH